MQETPQQTPPQSAPDHEKIMAMAEQLDRERLTGIGGWLIVFIVLTILGLLGSVFSLVQGNPYMTGGLSTIIMLRSLISLILGIIVLVLLFGKKASFPRVAKLYLILEIILGVVATGITYVVLSDAYGAYAMEGAVIAGLLGGLVVSLAISFAWIAYFNKSKRVRYTFVN